MEPNQSFAIYKMLIVYLNSLKFLDFYILVMDSLRMKWIFKYLQKS